ncbi:MAG TPA: 50S ribosomal protein L11 methyltransferase [Gammaproteobacteria bacterium]|nr:50S ribosomal protein L11 methyltransferase [Gammaproteobacteria bacterium]
MSWIELRVTTTAGYADSLGDQLVLLGAKAVTFQDAGDQPIYEPDPRATAFWQDTIVVGLFEDSLKPQPLLAYMEDQKALGLVRHAALSDLPDQDWERICLDAFKPMQFGKRLWICPSWHKPPDATAVNVMLDPGLAFGTGTHSTTALCLEWLEEHIQGAPLVMDYGCGSGILGLSALKLGATSVIAVDNDPQALEATLKNSQRNPDVASRLQTYLPDDPHGLDVSVDVLIANILAGPLIELAPRFAALTHAGSDLLLSGILPEQAEGVMEAYAPWFDFKKPVIQKNEWVRLEGTRKKDPLPAQNKL